ncbi:hypothetical protein ACO9S2_11405 [Nitrospira sp. NS4]|uniref:hypothetical protein n=1 Tax=Nitrospira sp. NS4 TaxID=3414498 RepID=UPI003C2C878E
MACVAQLPPLADVAEPKDGLVVGRVSAVIMGERARKYEPEVRSFEVENQESRERFNVEIKSDDRQFSMALPPGDYRLNRVQISEGPFMSMAQLDAVFSVESNVMTYVGTWRFGVDSPKYGRKIVLSMIEDEQDMARAGQTVKESFPDFAAVPMVRRLPAPPQSEARLYEVMPYPRNQQYFRRHNW